MPRKARDERLDTRTARLKLAPRREPYWRNIQEGRALGYRRAAGGKAGNWIARLYSPGEGRSYEALGAADDLLEADGGTTLTFAQAQDRARAWFAQIERNAGRAAEPEPVTVRQAMTAYLADYEARGGKALADTRRAVNAHILPTLGDKLVTGLTFQTIAGWHKALASAPARVRAKSTAAKPATRPKPDTDDARRARRSTANRVLTVLKAALSLAYREGRVSNDDAWRRVAPFKGADAARVRYLKDDEAVRLANACPTDLRRLVTAALLTGCRYGELAGLNVGDYDAGNALLHVRQAKGGKPRAVPLTTDAVVFFSPLAVGKAATALLLTRADGSGWGKSHQFRPLREACVAANISPAVSFHVLRHTFASRLARQRVPMSIIAAALGNGEAICAKHYAHLAPDYIADTIRKYAGGMGLPLESTDGAEIVPLRAVRT